MPEQVYSILRDPQTPEGDLVIRRNSDQRILIRVPRQELPMDEIAMVLELQRRLAIAIEHDRRRTAFEQEGGLQD